jgi:predicted acyl esterase
MRKDVEFKTQDGVRLAAWHYLPEQKFTSKTVKPPITSAPGVHLRNLIADGNRQQQSRCAPGPPGPNF